MIMAALPAHPESHGEEAPDAPRRSRWTWVWVAVGVILVVGFVVLHLTGVLGPEAH
jgi:hypothetical protein